MARNFMMVDPELQGEVMHGLASPLRVKILKLLHDSGPLNINEIARQLELPQSTVSSNVAILESAGLMRSEVQKAKKGNQKICHSLFGEILVAFPEMSGELDSEAITVSMPPGLFTNCEVSAPCGLCSTEAIIGLLDVPQSFLDPDRMKAALIWFTRGFAEYQFPNNARLSNSSIEAVEFSMELSSEMPATSLDWPSDITLWVNGQEVGTWTSPGDFGDKRGIHTPEWWKLKGSQYGKLKTWRIGENGTYVDGVRISDVTIADLDVSKHHSIRMRIGIREDAVHPGGINIFGRGFGNYDQDIILRLYLKK